jgi:predicted dehydrogenase
VSKRVRVAVAGAGRAGEVHALNLANRVTIAELVAIIDQDLNLANQLAQKVGGVRSYQSLSDALKSEKFEALFITTPTHTHAPLTIEAAENGVHVFARNRWL